ncbi:zinc-binding alcohol dehydrogenase family protein [Thalassotalea sp. Y01]|uniref:zinc-binding alcohol dehydrogenase family protein n=1 Tax=Thalassotalea sp. Y01 TaxID=2729613 RepID=UPI00145DBC90|nr:zinc-binding alcohol dehydrogenase family protein [Thalassotalea sp. Y01]NMP16817.1 zinc-binding alcohol dehydrogenase family protein [Thalassotalea sp. Y01]
MKAIGYQHSLPISDENALQDIELEEPQAHGHDVLVEVQAVSVNPVDTKIRQHVSPENGQWKVLGWDAVGIVKSVGDNVTRCKAGDRVYYAGDLTRSGSNAQLQLVDERIIGHAPKSLSNAQAAALPLTSLTAWEMLFDRLQVETSQGGSEKGGKGKTLLIIGAAGGVGSIMVQLAKSLTNLTVIGTASRSETKTWLQQLGTHQVINHRNPLSQELASAGIDEVDYVVSLTNTEDHWPEIVKVIKPQGKFGLIDDPSSLDVVALKSKSVSLHWEFMYTRSMYQTDDMVSQSMILNEVASMVEAGQLQTTMGENFGTINAENLRNAHALLESQKAKGKIVLEGF